MNLVGKVKMKQINTIIFCAMCLLASVEIHASDNITVKNNALSKVRISRKGVTRIGLLKDRIASVYGEEDLYILEQESQLGQIFIKPREKEPFQITLVSEKGKSIDLRLTPSETDNKSLMLKIEDMPKIVEGLDIYLGSSYDAKLKTIMSALLQGKTPKGFSEETVQPLVRESLDPSDVQTSNNIKTKTHKNIETKTSKHINTKTFRHLSAKTYLHKNLKAQVLLVKNDTKESVFFHESRFVTPGVQAIAVSAYVLKPGEVGRVCRVGQV